MNFKKRVNGSWTDTPYYIHKTDTDILTTLPADIYANDTTATVGLKGNMSQSGTPTPDNPIMPQGTGERTGNLFDENYSNISDTIRYIPLYVGEGSFTLSTTTPYDRVGANVFLLSGNVSTGASTPKNGAWLNHNVTAQSVDGYVTIAYRYYPGTTSPDDCQTMLNTGSTALPYEPYGVKIPISSANTTTPVYLGEVETTRRVKKLVLTGAESWSTHQSTYYITVSDYYRMYDIGSHLSVCSHYPDIQVIILPEMHYGLGGLVDGLTHTVWNGNIVFNPSPMISSLTDWKAFLAQQYAAGTPVTVWYVLETEETGIVNEPLRKIGTYADTVSGITIPTIAGANTLSIGTTLQPSEVSVNYHGWHPVQSVHERENGAWA